MRTVSFVEGANPRKGGLGLVGVPLIVRSLAERGHQAVLVIGGRVNPGREEFVQPDAETALQRKCGSGAFGITAFRAWGNWAFAPAILWRMSRWVRQADFVSLHSLYSFPVLAGYLLARLHGKPYGLWPHGVLAPVQRRISRRRKWLYDRLAARRILTRASVLFFSSTGEGQETRCLDLRTPAVVVPHGIDTSEYAGLPRRGEFRARYLAGHRGPLALYLGRLNAKKGLDLLIRAMALVVQRQPEAKLAIVGAGDPPSFTRQVLKWVQECDLLRHIVLTGPIASLEGKRQAFADADLFAFTSQAENFGFAVFEAMASGVPLVVSERLDYAREIARCQAGLTVGLSPADQAGAILKLLGDPGLRHRMGANGRRMAQGYSWASCGGRVERVIQAVLEGRSLPADLALPE